MDRRSRIPRARALRQDQTDVERKLWALLRSRQLDGFKFRRQVPIDRYFADFACRDANIIVELDGSQHLDRIAYDAERTRVLEACGWRVLRFWNNQVLETPEGVLETILAELRPLLPRPWD
jgi:very-short-patch-repair endonuclease